jgi:hypothetical protein
MKKAEVVYTRQKVAGRFGKKKVKFGQLKERILTYSK